MCSYRYSIRNNLYFYKQIDNYYVCSSDYSAHYVVTGSITVGCTTCVLGFVCDDYFRRDLFNVHCSSGSGVRTGSEDVYHKGKSHVIVENTVPTILCITC